MPIKVINANNYWHFNIYEQDKFSAQLKGFMLSRSLMEEIIIVQRVNPYNPSVLTNSADPVQMLQSAFSDQDLLCLLTECSIKIEWK